MSFIKLTLNPYPTPANDSRGYKTTQPSGIRKSLRAGIMPVCFD